MAERGARLVGWVAVAFFIVFGIWAFVAPHSFFTQVAVFPPYNKHFLHDVGAFQIGIGVTLVLGLLGWDGLGAATGGAGLGGVFHAAAHIIDHDLGGRSTDPIGLGLLAVALLWAAWVRRPARPAAKVAAA
jgi:hypothetical protein